MEISSAGERPSGAPSGPGSGGEKRVPPPGRGGWRCCVPPPRGFASRGPGAAGRNCRAERGSRGSGMAFLPAARAPEPGTPAGRIPAFRNAPGRRGAQPPCVTRQRGVPRGIGRTAAAFTARRIAARNAAVGLSRWLNVRLCPWLLGLGAIARVSGGFCPAATDAMPFGWAFVVWEARARYLCTTCLKCGLRSKGGIWVCWKGRHSGVTAGVLWG